MPGTQGNVTAAEAKRKAKEGGFDYPSFMICVKISAEKKLFKMALTTSDQQ